MATQNTWTRERVNLTADHLKRARRLLATSKVPGRGIEWADTATTGLLLRVGPLGGAWLLKTEARTVRLGDMDALPVPAARAAAQQARLDLRAGRNPRASLEIYAEAIAQTDDVGLSVEAAFPEEVVEQSDEDRRRDGPWQWRDLVDAYLATRLPKLKPGWAEQYEGYLRHPAFERISTWELARLDIDVLEEIRDRIAKANSVSTAARAVNQGKAMLTWAWKYHRRLSRLGKTPWWQGWSIEYAASTRDHEPTLPELGRTLALAERHRVLGTTDQETSAGMLKALWAVVLTAQRTGALAATRRDRVIPMPGRPGWEVWTWSAGDMKGGKAPRPHALPIPPAALEALSRFDESDGSEWAFPSRALGKHVTSDGLNQMLYRLQGKAKAGKKDVVTLREVDLFKAHRIRIWTPHDVRRTLGSFLAEEELGGAASAILAHKTGRKDDEDARLEDITRKVYAKAQRLDLKARGMEAWVAAVLDAYAREAAALDRSAAADARRSEPNLRARSAGRLART